MVSPKTFWRNLWILVRHRRFRVVMGILLLLLFLSTTLLIVYHCVFDELSKLFYAYNKDEVRVVEDSDFPFYEKNYTEKYKLNSKYYLSHRILLIPDSKSIPIHYEFDGEMLIEIFDKNHQLLHSFKTNKPINLLREGTDDYFEDYLIYIGKNTSHVTSVFAFELGEIPFDLIRLKWNRLKNMKIKITVLKPEKKLLEFCDRATLVIIPDLRL